MKLYFPPEYINEDSKSLDLSIPIQYTKVFTPLTYFQGKIKAISLIGSYLQPLLYHYPKESEYVLKIIELIISYSFQQSLKLIECEGSSSSTRIYFIQVFIIIYCYLFILFN